jgi:DNA-binding NarL/FixJ family response regulator
MQRYGSEDWSEVFQFSEDLHRIEIDLSVFQPAIDSDEDWEVALLDQIDKQIAKSESKIIIVDNITWLSRETDKGKFALPLMQRLSTLKRERGLSMLIACHTPKRDETRPITVNDLAGSKILANFADSIFAIGKSAKDSGRHYLKQIKSRSAEKVYDTDSVAVFDLLKSESKCFLGFEYVDEEPERIHLKEFSRREQTRRIKRAHELKEQGYSVREIAADLEVSVSTAHKYVKAETPETPEIEIE